MPTNTPSAEPDLRTYGRVLWRGKWWVVGIMVVGLVVSLGYTLTATKRYSASAQILVQPPNGSVDLSGTSPTITPTDVATDLQLLTSAPVVGAVEARLHDTHLNVSSAEEGQTEVIAVTATDTSPSRAALIANTYAKEFVSYETKNAVQTLTTVELQLESQINAIDSQLSAESGTPQGTALGEQETVLKEQLAQLQVMGVETSGGVELVSPASVPTVPSSPKKTQNITLGLLAGLLLGITTALVVNQFDDAIGSKEEVERAAEDIPVMGVIPLVRGWRNRKKPYVVTSELPTSQAAEAYRSLRTSLQFAAQMSPTRLVLVTSPTASEGKSSTVSNLGVVLARAGLRVVLVSADLRRPRLASFFGLNESVGLTSIVIDDRSVTEALQEVEDVPGLSLLGAGPLLPNPAELLSSPKALEIFRELSDRFDIVLIDSPPVLPVTDSVVLAQMTDLTLLVVSAGNTKIGQLARAREQLEQVAVERLGIVLNRVTRESGRGYGYEYRYSSHYQGKGDHSSRPQSPRPETNGHVPSDSAEDEASPVLVQVAAAGSPSAGEGERNSDGLDLRTRPSTNGKSHDGVSKLPSAVRRPGRLSARS